MKYQSTILRERYLNTPVNEIYTIGALYDKQLNGIATDYYNKSLPDLRQIAKVKKFLVKYYANLVFDSYQACEMSEITYRAALIMFGRLYAVSQQVSYSVLRTKDELAVSLIEIRILECIFMYLFKDKHTDDDLYAMRHGDGYMYISNKECRPKYQRKNALEAIKNNISNQATLTASAQKEAENYENGKEMKKLWKF